ncbi:MAG TPA: hypothetical protein VMX55_04610 [candidate division Zixibacteria bacterium]|nr:hypothetical protein [candidate division Zixibacteria bacterium]HUU88057.1 hypothetical protein [Candidatus Glassbacteria bacterium]
MVTKKIFTLEGKLLSPIITPSPLTKKGKCWCRVIRGLSSEKKPLRTYVGKLTKGERKTPTKQLAYRGFVRVTTIDRNEERGRKNILKYLLRDFLGEKTTEGYGKIQWVNYREEEYLQEEQEQKRKKLKLRKGLGPNYPKELQRLLIALMLHDFVKTERHPSKIFKEITIEDEEIREACLNHHNGEESKNDLLPIVKYYDHLASHITRKKPFKTLTRFDCQNGDIKFEELAKEIEQKQNSAYKLYNYIYNSRELTRIVESMTYGYNSLRNHLLLMVNLTINDYYQGKIVIGKGKIVNRNNNQKTKKSISESAT